MTEESFWPWVPSVVCLVVRFLQRPRPRTGMDKDDLQWVFDPSASEGRRPRNKASHRIDPLPKSFNPDHSMDLEWSFWFLSRACPRGYSGRPFPSFQSVRWSWSQRQVLSSGSEGVWESSICRVCRPWPHRLYSYYEIELMFPCPYSECSLGLNPDRSYRYVCTPTLKLLRVDLVTQNLHTATLSWIIDLCRCDIYTAAMQPWLAMILCWLALIRPTPHNVQGVCHADLPIWWISNGSRMWYKHSPLHGPQTHLDHMQHRSSST